MLEKHECIICGNIFECPACQEGEEAPDHCEECQVPYFVPFCC